MRPPPRLTVSEWANEYRYLSAESSAEPGKWRGDRVPYMDEVMDQFTDPKVTRVVCQFGSQMGKSEVLLNIIGYYISQDPAPLLIVQPREHDAKQFSKNRVSAMIRDSPILKDTIQTPKSRESNNTILEKTFKGGRLILAGSNSPMNLAGNPCRIVLMDEVDRFAESSGTEGSPIELAEARTISFSNRKILLTSTPTMEDHSQIEKAYKDSDQRQYWVPCWSCGEYQVLRWQQVKWDKNEEGHHDPSTARYHCEHCDARWSEAQRHKSVREGEWRARKETKGTAGFQMSALYSPWANMSLANLADKWLKAQGKPLLLRTFINTVLGECFQAEKYEQVDETGLLGRAEKYPMHESGYPLVPNEVTVIVAGADVQDSRLELLIVGYGSGEESWVISHHVFPGDPGTPDVWASMWETIIAPMYYETGEEVFVRATACDTGGHFTQQAYSWAGPRFRYQAPNGDRCFVLPIKGQAGNGDIWPRRPSYKNLAKIPLFPIRVAPAKEVIYSRLNKVMEPGPGFMHFPEGLDDEFYRQLTAERVVTKWDARGFPKRVWELKYDGRSNEILDMSVYAYSAVCFLESSGFKLNREAEQRAAEIQGHPPELEARASEPGVSATPPSGQAASPSTRPGGAATPGKQRGGVTRSSYLGR